MAINAWKTHECQKKRKREKEKKKCTMKLEKTVNLASLKVDVDIKVARGGGKTGNGLDIRSQSIPWRRISTVIQKYYWAISTYR